MTSGLFDIDVAVVTNVFFKVLVGGMLLSYVFFSLFLYLRVRILSLTLITPNAGVVRYAAFLHFVATIGLAFLLGILLLF